MKHMRHTSFLPSIAALASVCLLWVHPTQANNIQVTNPTLTGNTGTSALVQFDLSWENSWRGGGVSNWDAAWIFVKYRTIGGVWQHVLLNNTGHTAPAGSMIDLGLLIPGGTPWDANTNPVIGTFIRRSADGNGTFALIGVQLRWNYGTLGLAYNDISQVQVFAIEMVAVSQSAFAAGSTGSEVQPFTLTTISTSNATSAPSGSGALGGQAGGYPTGQTAPTNITWPNGFNASYCMKYELSQQAYVDFLNTLSYTQQVTRTTSAPNSVAGTGALIANGSRNGIDIQAPGVSNSTPAVYACNLDGDAVYGETVDGKDLAINYMGWGDLTAYLDWSGLRPMTELEFEKACRGPLPPVANEYAWGTTSVYGGTYTLSNVGASNEGIASGYSTTQGNANYNFNNGTANGPQRVGIFASNGSNTGRISAGATYYGMMSMSDNLWERVVTLANVEGRAFTGTHGNGALAVTGDSDAFGWPAVTALGVAFRGTCWNFDEARMRIASRGSAVAEPGRFQELGGRGVRSAP